MRSGSDRHVYTTGGDDDLLHTKVLGSGGFGNVHEVNRFITSSDLLRCTTSRVDRRLRGN
jgi:hypothetical protein